MGNVGAFELVFINICHLQYSLTLNKYNKAERLEIPGLQLLWSNISGFFHKLTNWRIRRPLESNVFCPICEVVIIVREQKVSLKHECAVFLWRDNVVFLQRKKGGWFRDISNLEQDSST